MINFSEIRKQITTDQIIHIVCGWGVSKYEDRGTTIVFPTVCHNPLCEQESMKLYYYDNNKIFRCYTECDSSFDIFELGVRISKLNGRERSLFDVAEEIMRVINYEIDSFATELRYLSPLKPLRKNELTIPYKEYELRILNYFKSDKIPLWESEKITKKAMKDFDIGFYTYQNKIVIPHFDPSGKLIGIRGRSLNPEDIKKGKYMPIMVNGILYSHPLSFNLYGLNKTKESIKKSKIALIFEGEKSVLLSESYYGEDNIAVACCGSSINKFQLFLLIKLCGITEVVICFDRQFDNQEDKEKYFYKLDSLCEKYSNYCKMSFIFDDKELTKYKDSPIDCGKEIFEQLLAKRTRSRRN